MRSARLLIAAGVLVVIGGLACSSDPMTDPFAPPGLALELTPSVDTIFVGDTISKASPITLSLVATSLGRPVQPPKGVEWTSSNPAAAIVVAGGVVSAVGIGTTTVTARVNDDRARATIVVAHRK